MATKCPKCREEDGGSSSVDEALGGAAKGAAAGAAVGSMIPIVGTAIGAGVGGVLGLFGTKTTYTCKYCGHMWKE